jgi:SAM-dependent methyltransferase
MAAGAPRDPDRPVGRVARGVAVNESVPSGTIPAMDNGWQGSADAWVADMGELGDFGRRYVLDPVMLPRAVAGSPGNALDVGCGEGRFCRMLRSQGVDAVGVDPTRALIAVARTRDAHGTYVEATAERLPFREGAFDLVVSYLSLIDIPDVEAAIPEMARVLKPGGALLIANLTSFNTACADVGWVKDAGGRRVHYPIDNYLEERAMWIEYRGIRVVNHHRPLRTYLRTCLGAGLVLTYFDEPAASVDAPPSRARGYDRAPWFLVMEWRKPPS